MTGAHLHGTLLSSMQACQGYLSREESLTVIMGLYLSSIAQILLDSRCGVFMRH